MAHIYTNITEETLKGAKARALKELQELTGGKAETAIECVVEILELDGIIAELEKREQLTKLPTFKEMLGE